jgi:hypothetical protein
VSSHHTCKVVDVCTMLSLQQFSEPSTPTWQTPIPPFPRYQLQHIGGLPVLPTQCTMERKYHFLRVCFLAFGCVSSFSLSSCGLHLLPFLFFLKIFYLSLAPSISGSVSFRMTIFSTRLRSTCIVLSSRHLCLLYLAITIDVNGTIAFQMRRL